MVDTMTYEDFRQQLTGNDKPTRMKEDPRMSSDINTVVLVGRLTRDPEIKTTQGGMKITNIGLAVNSNQKDPQTGEWGDKPNFFDVTFFGDRFHVLAQHLEKGKRIGVTGRLEYSQWESDGQKRSKVGVVGTEFQFLDNPKVSETNADTNSTASREYDESIPF